MKYIKLFETFQKINGRDIDDWYSLQIPFSEKEIEIINNDIIHGREQSGIYPVSTYTFVGRLKTTLHINVRNSDRHLFIYKVPDEYYILHDIITEYNDDNNKFYKCDQMHGLLDCISEKLKNWEYII
mgnify:CR=1 FL=1